MHICCLPLLCFKVSIAETPGALIHYLIPDEAAPFFPVLSHHLVKQKVKWEECISDKFRKHIKILNIETIYPTPPSSENLRFGDKLD